MAVVDGEVMVCDSGSRAWRRGKGGLREWWQRSLAMVFRWSWKILSSCALWPH